MERCRLSPAKVNLFLKVLSKREDGYHNILSIVDPVSLYDVIYLRERSDGEVTVGDNRNVLPRGKANTMYRAARLVQERFGVRQGADIFVEKKIPIGAGLGGPSSNAATVITELMDMWRLTLTRGELLELGKAVGADVPLFLSKGPSVISGIGEKVSPIELPVIWYVIVYPYVTLQAGDVYGGLKIVLTNTENDITLRRKFETIHDVAGILENDLETVSITMCPTIRAIKEKLLEAGALGSLMSGSGSSVFGIFGGEEEAADASAMLGNLGEVFIVHSIKEGGYGDYGCEGVPGE